MKNTQKNWYNEYVISGCSKKEIDMIKKADDYSGFFAGQVPDYATSLLGTPNVEASQVKSMFGRANEAIDLVNQFDSSLLSNITFVFNFARGGAYGVYLSALDKAIKTKALKKQLEQRGYIIEETSNGLTAFPKKEGEKTSEQIQADIDNLYGDLESKGGTAIGVNMDKVLGAAKMDATSSNSKDPNTWEWMAILHLGGTIVHEAIHAKGSRDEGASEAGEARFNQWALPIINKKYQQSMEAQGKGEEFAPLTMGTSTRHAKKEGWYKTAQMSYYIPPSFLERPLGSDLNGRHPKGINNRYPNTGIADWSMIAQENQSIPIEKRLGRQYMSPLPQDLDQANDIIEEQLRKSTRGYTKLDPHATISELLSEGYDEDRGYTTLEGLLDEKRPKPIIVPLQKAASLNKIATLFGWMNNLAISDGNTIPGLGDRVMAWDDRDEDFAEEESWIKKQPRYNPSQYDVKGFYFRWIEPRFAPQLFDDMTRDYTNTHPAKRFASRRLIKEAQLFELNRENFESLRGQIENGIMRHRFMSVDVNNEIVRYYVVFNENDAVYKVYSPNHGTLFADNIVSNTGAAKLIVKDIEERLSLQKELPAPEQPEEQREPEYVAPKADDELEEIMGNNNRPKRFAFKVDSETSRIISILSTAKQKITNGEVTATRFVVTQDVMPLIDRVFSGLKVNVFYIADIDKNEALHAVWVSSEKASEQDIEKVEKYLQGKDDSEDAVNIIESLFGIEKQKKSAIQNIINIVKNICNEYEIKGIYVSGEYPRLLATKSPLSQIESLDFGGGWGDQILKLGAMVAEKLGVVDVKVSNKSSTVSFNYKDINVSFNGVFDSQEIKGGLKDRGVNITPFALDIFNKDFTINMLTYSIDDDTIRDETKLAKQSLDSKIIETYFDPDYVCINNPMVILRAIKLRLKHGFNIDEVLAITMKHHANDLLNKYSKSKLITARENVLREGRIEGEKLLKEFGLEQLLTY